MKILLFTCSLLLIIGCKNTSDTEATNHNETTTVLEESNEDEMNVKVPDEEDGGEMFLGKINFKGMKEEPCFEWFDLNKEGHLIDSIAVDSLNPLLKNISIKVFMGTWCGDSQREVPALEKILQAANYKMSMLDMVAVNHEKNTPEKLEEGYELEYVPSIIFFKDGAEINRIVEYPQETLEKDMLKILSGKPYKHAYAE